MDPFNIQVYTSAYRPQSSVTSNVITNKNSRKKKSEKTSHSQKPKTTQQYLIPILTVVVALSSSIYLQQDYTVLPLPHQEQHFQQWWQAFELYSCVIFEIEKLFQTPPSDLTVNTFLVMMKHNKLSKSNISTNKEFWRFRINTPKRIILHIRRITKKNAFLGSRRLKFPLFTCA